MSVFQIVYEYNIPALDANGRYLPVTAQVTPTRYPELCANVMSGKNENLASTQQTFTGVRALRVISRIASAVRLIRAAITFARLARLLGGSKPLKWDGHQAMVTDVCFVPPSERKVKADQGDLRGWRKLLGWRRKEEATVLHRWRFFSASVDNLVLMYDVLSQKMQGLTSLKQVHVQA